MYRNVLGETTMYGYDMFLMCVSKLTVLDFVIVDVFCLTPFISKTTSLRYLFEKVPSARWPHTMAEGITFYQNLSFRLYFIVETSIFNLLPIVRFLCLNVTSFRRCANTSRISDIFYLFYTSNAFNTLYHSTIYLASFCHMSCAKVLPSIINIYITCTHYSNK